MRDDLEAERAAHAGLQRRHADLNDFSVSRIAELEAVAEGAFREAEEARRLAESRMPPEVSEGVWVSAGGGACGRGAADPSPN